VPPADFSYHVLSETKFEVSIDGHRFDRIGWTYRSRDAVTVLVGRCADCGTAFSQHLTEHQWQYAQIRQRCPVHHVEGLRVERLHPDARGEPPSFQSVGVAAFHAPGRLTLLRAEPKSGTWAWVAL